MHCVFAVCVCVCGCVFVVCFICMCVCICAYVYVRKFVLVRVYVCMGACVHACLCVYMIILYYKWCNHNLIQNNSHSTKSPWYTYAQQVTPFIELFLLIILSIDVVLKVMWQTLRNYLQKRLTIFKVRICIEHTYMYVANHITHVI